MDGSIALTPSQRNGLLRRLRTEPNPQIHLRAHILLLLADGRPWSLIITVLYCSSATIARWQKRFLEGGLAALDLEERGRPPSLWAGWATVVVCWVKQSVPRDFGFYRSRWCCKTLVVLLLSTYRVNVSCETVRRWLHQHRMVWRRPRPVLKPKDPSRYRKRRNIRELLANLPEDHAAVFQDEVDLNLNPEIGCMWMEEGKQAKVITPGTNVKRYLAGSMSWRSGELIVTQGLKRDAALFVAHLDDLRRRLRHYKVIHVICDNARFHKALTSKVVRQYLQEHADRIQLHYLPAWSPQDNPIERVWWHLREEITRNHQCQNIDELVKLTMVWLDERCPFKIEGRFYEELRKAA